MDIDWIKRFIVSDWGVAQTKLRIVQECCDFYRAMSDTEKISCLLQIVTFIDLTSLGGDDTRSNITRLCIKAMNPVLPSLLKQVDAPACTVAAVCVYPARVADAVSALSHSEMKQPRVPVASVATGFPSGQYPLKTRLAEIEFAVSEGAKEIDVVIDRSLAITGQWESLFDELVQMKKACGAAHMKTILAVGELPTLTHVYRASMVAMYAGSDFIKTSTGKEAVNATVPTGITMARAIWDFYSKTGKKVGLKAAGGLRTAKDAVLWYYLVREELGADWLSQDLFRIGASSLLAAVEEELYFIIRKQLPRKDEFLRG